MAKIEQKRTVIIRFFFYELKFRISTVYNSYWLLMKLDNDYFLQKVVCSFCFLFNYDVFYKFIYSYLFIVIATITAIIAKIIPVNATNALNTVTIVFFSSVLFVSNCAMRIIRSNIKQKNPTTK